MKLLGIIAAGRGYPGLESLNEVLKDRDIAKRLRGLASRSRQKLVEERIMPGMIFNIVNGMDAREAARDLKPVMESLGYSPGYLRAKYQREKRQGLLDGMFEKARAATEALDDLNGDEIVEYGALRFARSCEE